MWALLAVLAFWALLWAAVPPLVKSQLPKLLGEQLGRKVGIGAVEFKPWTLELYARDLTVATADGKGIQARIDRIYLNAEIESLLRLAPVLDAVHLDAPRLSITRRADGSLDIDDIQKQLASGPKPAQDHSNEPFKFALHDVVVQNGAVEFVDRVVDSTHKLQDLNLRVPTLSSLPSARETRIEPRLSFKLDGVAFEATGSSTPYADSRNSDATLTFSGFDIAPYLVYLPTGLPVQPESARLDAQLQIGYVQTPEPALKISGPVTAHDVAVATPAGAPLLVLDRVRITLANLSPLQQQAAVERIEIDAPRVALRREEDGMLALSQPAAGAEAPAAPAAGTATAAAPATATGKTADTAALAATTAPTPAEKQVAEPAKPWQVSVQQIAMKEGQLVWVDRSTQPQAQAHLRQLQLQASDIAYPFKQPARFDGSATIGEQIPQGDAPLTASLAAAATDAAADTPLRFEGKATDTSATVQWKLEPLALDLVKPYLVQFLVPQLRGKVSAQGALEWQAAATSASVGASAAAGTSAAPGARTVVRLDRLLLDQIALVDPDGDRAGKPLASVAKLEVADAMIDLARRTARIGNLSIDDPSTHVRRNADGRWMAQDWLKAAPATDAAAATADASEKPVGGGPPADAAPAWSLKLDRFALKDGDVSYTDAALAEQTVEAALTQIDMQASNVAYPPGAQMALNGSAQIAAPPSAKPTPFQFDGTASAEGGQVALKLDGLPVAAAEPLLAQFLKPSLTGQVTLDGAVQWSVAPAGAAEVPEGSDAGIRLVVRANRLALQDLALKTGEEEAPVRVGLVEVTDADVDLSSQHVQVGQLQIVDPKADVARSVEGRWMFEDWLKQPKNEEGTKKKGTKNENTNASIDPMRRSANVSEEAAAREAAKSDETPVEPGKPAGWSFALNDFKLEGGDISYTDRALAEQAVRAELAKLQLQVSGLALPFAEPATFGGSAQLSTADVPGSAPVTFSGKASDTRADMDVRLEGVPFAAARPFYAKFLKPTLSGNATLDGAVQWQAATGADDAADARLTLRANRLTLNDIALAEADRRLAGIAQVTVADAAVNLLNQRVQIGKVDVRAPKADVTRNADGQWMFEDWLRSPAGTDAAGNDGGGKKSAPQETAWKVDLTQLSVSDGRIGYRDQALAEAPVAIDLSKLELQADKLGFPLDKPANFKGSALLANEATAAAPSKLAFSGSASAAQAKMDLKADGLPLMLAQPFYASMLAPTLTGRASIDSTLQWQAAKSQEGTAKVLVQADRLALDDVALAQDGNELARVAQVAVSDATLDLAARTVQVGKVRVDEPVVTVRRDAQGRWMYQQWLRNGAATTTAAAPTGDSAEQSSAAAGDPWAVRLADVALAGGRVAFRDQAQPSPVAFDLSRIQLETQNVTLDGTGSAPLHVSAQIAPPTSAGADAQAQGDAGGQLDYRGQLTLKPQLQTNGKVEATRIPVHLFEPYFASQLNIEIARADASFQGDTDYAQTDAGAKMSVRGDVTVQDLRANAVAAAAPSAKEVAGAAAAPDATDDTQIGDELVSWKTLNLTGLNVAIAPGQAASVSLEQTALTDFFARMILYPDGKLNLQGLVKSDGASGAGSDDTTAAATAEKPAARIDIGTTSFVDGRIFFTDLLIKPNYSARLSDLTGKLGAFSSRVPASGQPELARLELRGSTEQSASIEVEGRLNPLAKPLALDIAGKVRDLELPPFSPYAVKYAGHPIERGRLSMDVNYRIKPSGQLTADNNLVLTQLRFGEEVPGAPNSLPVKLATALLANSEGVIDLDLPISGSIDDPQFSIADVLGNAVGNLLGKAVTAPFSLIARAIGGIADAGSGGGEAADALNEVAFPAGSPELTASARSGLDKVAKALMQRDSLQLTIAGTAGNPAEREAWKQAKLARQIDRERLNAGSANPAAPAPENGEPGGASDAAGTSVTGNDASGAASSAADAGTTAPATPLPSSPLSRLYEQSDIPKPRNPDGAAQPLSDNEMQRLLLSRFEANDEALRELATQRGVAVREYLESAGLSKSRLFLGEARLVASDQLAEASSGAAAAGESKSGRYLPHAELNLETR